MTLGKEPACDTGGSLVCDLVILGKLGGVPVVLGRLGGLILFLNALLCSNLELVAGVGTSWTLNTSLEASEVSESGSGSLWSLGKRILGRRA